MPKDDRVMVNFRISRDVAKHLKIAAITTGKTVQEILSGAVSDYISAHESGQARELAATIEEARVRG